MDGCMLLLLCLLGDCLWWSKGRRIMKDGSQHHERTHPHTHSLGHHCCLLRTRVFARLFALSKKWMHSALVMTADLNGSANRHSTATEMTISTSLSSSPCKAGSATSTRMDTSVHERRVIVVAGVGGGVLWQNRTLRVTECSTVGVMCDWCDVWGTANSTHIASQIHDWSHRRCGGRTSRG
mmetsp:Transcript_18709/g.52039  ORF Transcript_18709/g.52039 Transcript_18709/m.52039 type:complete len:181 (-) Transcript_18709:1088-1630(-)